LLIALSTLAVNAERSTAAGCANWLSGSHAEHGFSADSADDAHSVIRFLSPELSHPVPVPCNGPNCGRAPRIPLQPASASVVPSIKIFGCSQGCATLPGVLEAGPPVSDALVVELAGYPTRIDRPPVL
jgi:hypothetical protein